MAARLPPESIPPLAHSGNAAMGASPHPPDRLPGHQLLRRTACGKTPRKPRRGGSADSRHIQPPRHPAGGAESPERNGRGRGDGLRERENHPPRGSRRKRHHFLLVQRSSERLSRPRAPLSRQRGELPRQFFRRAQLGSVLRRLVRLHPKRRALPHGAEHLFPHQCGRHRPVRAHAHRGRR